MSASRKSDPAGAQSQTRDSSETADQSNGATGESAPSVELVKMTLPDAKEGMPSTADVHPDEVEHMTKHGWRRA